MSVLTEQLQKASFRGVPFEVTAASLTAGRRTVVHEYPQRDKPYVEDLGRASRKLTIKAFVVGSDYLARAQRLLAAIEKPGPGTLVHPWLGEMRVTLSAVSELTFDTALGVANVTFTATEAGELEFPSATADRTGLVLAAADTLSESAISRFVDSISLSPVSEYVNAALSGDLLDVLGVVSNADLAKVFDLADGVADLASKGLSLISTDPRFFAETLAGALGLSRWATTATAWSRVAKQLGHLVGNDRLSSGTTDWIAATKEHRPMSAAVKTAKQNRAAVETVTRQLLTAQAVGAAAMVGTATDVTDPSFGFTLGESLPDNAVVMPKSYDELVAVRDAVMEVLEAEMLRETDDVVYTALVTARTAVFEVLTERAESESRLVTVVPADVTPALVLAYDWHDDAGRDFEIAARNSVVREGFCPAVETRVLSE